VAVVVPARDEARHLGGVLASIPAWVDLVVVVDDGSRDATAQCLVAWGDARGLAVRWRSGRGVGAAILEGYRQALARGARVAAVVAGDGQMDLSELEAVVDPVLAGHADYVQGTRFEGGRVRGRMPLARRLGNRLLSRIASWAARHPVSDSQCGYTAASARFLAALATADFAPGYGIPAYLRVHAHQAGWRVAEVPVRAIYADEVSGIRPWRDPPRIAWRLVRLGAGARWRRAAASPTPLPAARPGPAG
jgi:glycosyltransferase involved in cell wall biosynthesis